MQLRDIPIRIAGDAHGIRALIPGNAEATMEDLHARFPGTTFQPGMSEDFRDAISHIENPESPPPRMKPIGTTFQQKVWSALCDIPQGSTMDYSTIASKLDQPKAARAIAAACAANPIAILIPCHRVIRRDGSLSGYRWGMDLKARLLAREQSITPFA